MFNLMKELVRQKYPGLICSDHPRALDADSEPDHEYADGRGHVGDVFAIGYARAMMRSVLT